MESKEFDKAIEFLNDAHALEPDITIPFSDGMIDYAQLLGEIERRKTGDL